MEAQRGASTERASASPGHNVFSVGEVTFDSDFDNGNLGRVEIGDCEDEFLLWAAQDNAGTPHESKHCSWFHFKVSGSLTGKRVKLVIMNSNKHAVMYKHDMRPVFRYDYPGSEWRRIASPVKAKDMGTHYQLHFEHSFAKDAAYFAWTYPYSYSTCQADLARLEGRFRRPLDADDGATDDDDGVAKNSSDIGVKPSVNLAPTDEDIYFHREVLTTSIDGRNIDLITVSDHHGILPHTEANYGRLPVRQGQSRARSFEAKPYCFVSARVHPGEVPASHVHIGMLEFLLSSDVRAAALRRKFVFVFVPMINPDGVYRGHFRMDQLGQNLNRFYLEPDPRKQPSVFAVKSVVSALADAGRLQMFLDMHGHASKRGCFIYGNLLDSLQDQVQNQLYCKLVGLNSRHFDYNACLFSREHMTRIDPGDKGMSAEGSGRVATYLTTGIIHSYTLECHYNCGRNSNEKFTPASYREIGEACAVALLDLFQANPLSKLPASEYRSLLTMYEETVTELQLRSEYRQRPAAGSKKKATPSSSSNKQVAGKGKKQTAVAFEAFQVQRVVMQACSGSGAGDIVPALAESLAAARRGNECKKKLSTPGWGRARRSADYTSGTRLSDSRTLPPRKAYTTAGEPGNGPECAKAVLPVVQAPPPLALPLDRQAWIASAPRKPAHDPSDGYSGRLRTYIRSRALARALPPFAEPDLPCTSRIADGMAAKSGHSFPRIFARSSPTQQSASLFMDLGPKSARSAVCTHE